MERDPARAFDGFAGTWNVRHRRLKQRLAGCDEWLEFDGTHTLWPLLGGQGNVDDNFMDMPEGPYHGASIRAYDPKTQRWSIWWLDSRFPGAIDTPVVGGFDECGVGSFYADETFEGRPIKVRFLWTNITPASRQWEQAFSEDGGRTWETNWIMWFTRTGA